MNIIKLENEQLIAANTVYTAHPRSVFAVSHDAMNKLTLIPSIGENENFADKLCPFFNHDVLRDPYAGKLRSGSILHSLPDFAMIRFDYWQGVMAAFNAGFYSYQLIDQPEFWKILENAEKREFYEWCCRYIREIEHHKAVNHIASTYDLYDLNKIVG